MSHGITRQNSVSAKALGFEKAWYVKNIKNKYPGWRKECFRMNYLMWFLK